MFPETGNPQTVVKIKPPPPPPPPVFIPPPAPPPTKTPPISLVPGCVV